MSETISAAQPQAEAVRGEGSDVALAKVLQEQEQAWLHLLQSQSPNIATSSLGDESLGARETASPTMPETDDWAFALEMQQQEYRQHAIRLAALQQQEHGNMDVDSMSYESLSMLGDTVGTVKVGVSASCKQQLKRCMFSEACSSGEDGVEPTCVICQHDFAAEEQVCKLPCKHMFHVDCIDTWLSSNKTCPVCMWEIGGG